MADRELSEDEVADLKEAFAMFDINGDGKISFFLMPRVRPESLWSQPSAMASFVPAVSYGCIVVSVDPIC